MKQAVTIIGAGPAGLTVAWFLTGKNRMPEIFEAGNETGGLAGSVNVFGEQQDIGPHIFLESCQTEAVALWKELGGDDLQRLDLSRGMVLRKKLIAFPPTPAGLLKCLGIIPLIRASIGFLSARIFNNKRADTAGSFFQNKYGNSFRSIVFNPFCKKYMGLPDDQVAHGFATGLTSFVKDSEPATEGTKQKILLYPKQGTKLIWDRMTEKIVNEGKIHFGKKLVRIIAKEQRIEKLCFEDGTETQPAFAVSTLPVTLFLKLLDNCPSEILTEASHLSSRCTILVYLKVEGQSFPHQYITVFDGSLEAGRITNFNSWKNTAGETTVLCIEYWCSFSDENWKCSDAAIVAKATAELESMHLIPHGSVKDASVLRLPHSHPVLDTSYQNSLKKINDYLGGFENLALTGRHASFKWDGQADNIIAGMVLAERIETYLTDRNK